MNVLVVLAIAGGLLMLLVTSQEAALDRVARAADAAVVEQIALGAEASVVDALRRDLDDAPETDHLSEPWALSVIQDEVMLPTGRFSVRVTDLQAKFDINQLAELTTGTLDFFRRLLTAVDQPPESANDIARIVSFLGGLTRLDELANFGIAPETLAAIAPHVIALPIAGTVNLNSVDPLLLQVMLQNRGQAVQLVSIRERQGFLTLDDLRMVGALRPQNSGLTSNVFQVTVIAEAGTAAMKMQTTLIRRNERGFKAVDILERRFIQDTPIAVSK